MVCDCFDPAGAQAKSLHGIPVEIQSECPHLLRRGVVAGDTICEKPSVDISIRVTRANLEAAKAVFRRPNRLPSPPPPEGSFAGDIPGPV